MEASRKEPSQHWLLQSGDWWDITGRGSLIQDKKLTERSCMMNVGWTIQFVRKRGFKRLVWGKFTETLNNVSTSSIKFFFSCVTLQSAIFFFFFFFFEFFFLKSTVFSPFSWRTTTLRPPYGSRLWISLSTAFCPSCGLTRSKRTLDKLRKRLWKMAKIGVFSPVGT